MARAAALLAALAPAKRGPAAYCSNVVFCSGVSVATSDLRRPLISSAACARCFIIATRWSASACGSVCCCMALRISKCACASDFTFAS